MRRVQYLRSGARKPVDLEPAVAERLARDFELRVCEATLRTDPGSLPSLWFLGNEYARRGRWEESLAVDLKLCKLEKKNPTVRYNLACSYARLGRRGRAFESLEQAIRLGFDDRGLIETDPDLEPLRTDPIFARLLILLERVSSRS